jgi:hypothetical protein
MFKSALVVLAGVVASAPATGDVIEFTFTGVIDSTGGSAPAPFVVGDAFTFVYRFDSGAADSDGAPNVGLFVGALEHPALTVGAWTAPSLGPGDIGVLDNGFAGDSYSGSIQTPLAFAQVGLTDFDGAAFVGDELPPDLNLGDWEIRNFALEVLVGPAYWNASGTVTGFASRVVPAPGAAAVGALGLLAGARRRR